MAEFPILFCGIGDHLDRARWFSRVCRNPARFVSGNHDRHRRWNGYRSFRGRCSRGPDSTHQSGQRPQARREVGRRWLVQVLAVPIGTYRALITASGFANEDINNVQVVAGATTNLNEVKLRVAAGPTEEVEVNGSAAVFA